MERAPDVARFINGLGEIMLKAILKGFRIRCQNVKDCNDEELFYGLETQAEQEIKAEIKGKLPKEIDGNGGFNYCLFQVKKIIEEA